MTRLDSITICGTTVGNSSTSCPNSAPKTDSDSSGFWNPVDIYYTSAATRAVIFLHGGGGTNYGMAYDLGLNVNSAPSTAIDIDFTWLTDNKVIAVFPQGQGIIGASGTWNNWVMDSGQDDVTMLQALAAYVKATYGVSKVDVVGHSNGGMMVNRMWCESPTTFDAYVALAGPASQHYTTAACAPSTKQPYFSMIGGQDTVLCVNGASTNAGPGNPVNGCDSGANFTTSATWTINSIYVGGFGSSSFVNPVLINDTQQQVVKATQMCGETSLGTPALDSSGLNKISSNCGGKLVLQEVLNANHPLSYGHNLCSSGDSCSLEVASGNGLPGDTGLLDVIVPFLTKVDP